MPREQMSEAQVAAYLHMDVREVVKLASRGQIPCRKVRGQFQFFKGDLDHWVERQMPKLNKRRLADIEKGVSRHHGVEDTSLIVRPLIPEGGVEVPLVAKTPDSVIRELVEVADRLGLVYNRDELVGEVRRREQLCTTALTPGVAMPHPRHPLPYDIAESFVIPGLTPSGVPFGAADGSLTRLFFLICCKDDRTHLHVLARLAQMLHDPSDVDALLAAEHGDELLEGLLSLEESAVA
jgi:PTS system nitrogen regulatory IIA component